MPKDSPWPVGYKLANPALADTLATIARDGTDAFYQGDIADDIANAVQNDPRQPGTLSAQDHRELPRQGARGRCASPIAPISVCGAGPPSSGAVTVGAGARPDRAI